MKRYYKIKEMEIADRPREKLMKYGAERLSDAELLAILLRTGRKGKNAIEIARALARKYEGKNLAEADFAEISAFDGIGPVKACEIAACFELGRRFFAGKKAGIFLKPGDVWNSLSEIRAGKKEHFVVLYLDTKNQEIRREIISIGTLNYNVVHPREVFEPAVKNLAASVIVAHNHPSGNLEPSGEDLSLTKRLAKAGEILGIEVLDHIIVSKEGYLSFKEKGLL